MSVVSGWSEERGQELVEFALVLPIVLLLLLAIVDFGLVIFRYDTVANVGREVARYGVVHQDQTEIDAYIANNVQRWTAGMDPSALQITYVLTPSTDSPVGLGTVRVEVAYQHRLLTGPVVQVVSGSPNLELRTVTTMYTE